MSKDTFNTGAQRDTQEGKPRFDLIPAHALLRLAALYQRGADQYGDQNWRKGMPWQRVLASLERHLQAFKRGEEGEDHLAAVVFNAMALMEYERSHPDLDDIIDRVKSSK